MVAQVAWLASAFDHTASHFQQAGADDNVLLKVDRLMYYEAECPRLSKILIDGRISGAFNGPTARAEISVPKPQHRTSLSLTQVEDVSMHTN